MEKEILYPKDVKLKRALQALIKLVLRTGNVRFQTATAAEAIMTEMQMVDDTSTNPKKASGTNHKKAMNYLKTLKTYAVLVPGKFAVVEIYIFTTDKKRIQTIDQLQEICSHDPDLQDMPTTSSGFDYSQKWIPQPRIIGPEETCKPQVLTEIAGIDAEIAKKQRLVQTAAPRKRHTGIFKGGSDMKAAKDAVIPRKMRVRGSKQPAGCEVA